jgi:hypothetical protein
MLVFILFLALFALLRMEMGTPLTLARIWGWSLVTLAPLFLFIAATA